MDKDRIVGPAKDFAGRVESAVGNIPGDPKTEAAGQLRDGKGTAQNLYGQAKDAARQASDAAVGYAKDTYENSGDAFRDGTQAIANKVEENPLGAMLVASAVGFALGLLLTRQPQRSPPRTRYLG
ncbi:MULTISPECIES: CsbD family protein [unclassified Bradyrhizobium]|uniref:CsbD family protein n=1 Tax=unclassified Bradyrhizobium TaxID=2631580 RepID=UPI000427BA7D|nr:MULTISPECIES: CsbD family protein [unclassified Bradyrhizobium]QIG97321.1 CsbD family protein [Bradyrhizobium sp. 6(2017)]